MYSYIYNYMSSYISPPSSCSHATLRWTRWREPWVRTKVHRCFLARFCGPGRKWQEARTQLLNWTDENWWGFWWEFGQRRLGTRVPVLKIFPSFTWFFLGKKLWLFLGKNISDSAGFPRRFVGHSLGAQLAVRCASLLHVEEIRFLGMDQAGVRYSQQSPSGGDLFEHQK